MNCILKNATVYTEGEFKKADITVCDGKIINIGKSCAGLDELDFTGCFIFPGFIDVHTHLREPGFEYKETIKTGTLAAAHGGYTHICTMPNLNPVPDTLQNLQKQLDIIDKDACIAVYPYASITKDEKGIELSDMEAMSKNAVAFSDDGKGVQSAEVMESAMQKAKKLNMIIAAHCEDTSLLNGGYIHDGDYAKRNLHRTISSESEYLPVKRDTELAKRIGCRYHVCHVSTKESVEVIRAAKESGVSVTCETAPHYLVFNDNDLKEDGRFKMNPPIRSESDRLKLIEGIKDGTVDMIATDHAPHSREEKSAGLEKSLMGIVGLETAFSVLYTNLVKNGVISLETLIKLMHDNPKRIFGIGTDIKINEYANFTVFNLDEKYAVNPDLFLSKGRSTPFAGNVVFGRCKMTMYKGEIVWKENLTEN